MAEAVVSPDLHKILVSEYPKDKIKKVKLDLSKIEFGHKLAYLLEDVFSKEECEGLIQHTESLGYSQAMVNFGERAVRAVGVRDSQRLMIDDKEFVKILFQRIGHFLPKQFRSNTPNSKTYKMVEINERLRFLKYHPGDSFKSHYDGQYRRPDGSAESQITLQIYLNEGMKGGETTFLRPGLAEHFTKPKNRISVKPKPGRILVFEHKILHEGTKVEDGLKYTIRCDVLYSLEHEAAEEGGDKQDKEEEGEGGGHCTLS